MEAILEAVKRSTRGKNEARRLRAGGRIPAVVYGAQKQGDAPEPEPVSVDPKPLLRILHSESGLNTLITLKVAEAGDARVLVKDFLLDPVTNVLLHVDFYRVNMDRKITVTVPVVLRGEPKGVKLQGGMMDFVHREVEIECLPAEIPDAIEIDISEMNLNDAIHLRDVAVGVSWTAVTDPDQMLVHVVTPRTAEEPAAEAAPVVAGSGSEPEVIKKGKTEKEGDDKKEK